ncbi:hypothetical protein HY449_03460 [Candidatus Pacearchaeota archaeon]|nr:hypothetical protein [Candidatus Pacearchaeota archaeon]
MSEFDLDKKVRADFTMTRLLGHISKTQKYLDETTNYVRRNALKRTGVVKDIVPYSSQIQTRGLLLTVLEKDRENQIGVPIKRDADDSELEIIKESLVGQQIEYSADENLDVPACKWDDPGSYFRYTLNVLTGPLQSNSYVC